MRQHFQLSSCDPQGLNPSVTTSTPGGMPKSPMTETAAASRPRSHKYHPLVVAVFSSSLLLLLFLFFAAPLLFSSTPSVVLATTAFTHSRHNLALVVSDDHNNEHYYDQYRRRPIRPSSTILLPDWEALLLLEPNAAVDDRPLSCLFQNGATSPASFSGVLPSSGNPTFRCSIPNSLRRHLPSHDPLLVDQSSHLSPPIFYPSEMLRWNHLVYESISTPVDVILFAKGINNRQGYSRSPSELLCVFYNTDVDSPSAIRTPVTTSSQEVFRCHHPKADSELLRRPAGNVVKVTLELAGEKARSTLSSVAKYRGRTPPPPTHQRLPAQGKEKSLICACTMVHNVAKFLPEWITYHSAIGVDRFVLYDNGSGDDLDRAVSSLVTGGFNISTYLWPWPKTQEAGFSHCAASHRDSCEWMMYLDVDEFVFSPIWATSPDPSRDMLPFLLPSSDMVKTGQVMLGCTDFGPSGQAEHPAAGVTQGYVCRKKAGERHKSLVNLDAVAESLTNAVHHFQLRGGYESRRVRTREAVVNHYKYQAWPEFRNKFRRRVSAYVVDWKRNVNPQSKDRTPGLGVEAVEPKGWKDGFCEVRDTALRDLSRRWFASVGPDGKEEHMVWESER